MMQVYYEMIIINQDELITNLIYPIDQQQHNNLPNAVAVSGSFGNGKFNEQRIT